MTGAIQVSWEEGRADIPSFTRSGNSTGWKCVIFDGNNSETITSAPDIMERQIFDRYLSSWEEETSVLSSGLFDNANYRAIVRMGEEAVPYIADVISREPSQIVHALSEICGDRVPYRPFMSLKRLCRLWLRILKREGRI